MSDTVLGWLFGGWFFGERDATRHGATPHDPRTPAPERSSVSARHRLEPDAVQETPEHDVIRRLRASDPDAFKMVFETYMLDLWRFARRFVPADVAEDLVQEVLADLWQRRETFESHGTLAQFLFRAIRNRTVNYRRHENIVSTTAQEADPEAPLGMGTGPQTPDIEVEANDLREALAAILRQLPAVQQAVIDLRWLYGMSYEQVASVLSISPVAARQHGSRAQRAMRQLLSTYFG